jgi:hypothetical protein
LLTQQYEVVNEHSPPYEANHQNDQLHLKQLMKPKTIYSLAAAAG